MNYFKADLLLSTEQLWLNPQGEYEGVDPDTYQDCGVIETITAETLVDLKAKIQKRLTNLDKFELVDDEDDMAHFEWQCDGEHDYRTPSKDQIPFIESWSLYIYRVNEDRLGAAMLKAVV